MARPETTLRTPVWRTPAGRLGLVVLVLLSALAVARIAGLGEAIRRGRPGSGSNVVYVQDGDTLRVRVAGKVRTVRLAGIDAPEMDQPGGAEARRCLEGLVRGVVLDLEPAAARGRDAAPDPSWEEAVDKYGRNLAHARLPDGRSLEREMVAAGWAWRFRGFATDKALFGLEETARRERRGLFAEPDPIPPWEWRESGSRR